MASGLLNKYEGTEKEKKCNRALVRLFKNASRAQVRTWAGERMVLGWVSSSYMIISMLHGENVDQISRLLSSFQVIFINIQGSWVCKQSRGIQLWSTLTFLSLKRCP